MEASPPDYQNQSQEPPQDDIAMAFTSGEFTSEMGTAGFFAYSNNKALSIVPNQPSPGYVCCIFEDMNDPLQLNSQMLYVPKDQFNTVVKEYLKKNG